MARNNDPFERKRDGSFVEDEHGERVPGPTLNLLFHAESEQRHRIADIVFFCRVPNEQSHDDIRRYEETRTEIARRDSSIKVARRLWDGDDPTDHKGLYEFLRQELPKLRRKYADRPLYVHASPGTPAMQTIWVLLVETGVLAPPVELIKSYRERERRGRPPTATLSVGLETFFRIYQQTRPAQLPTAEEAVPLDPSTARSPKLKHMFAQASRFAQVNVPVLLLGERGTGKTTLASWIRSVSPFRKQDLDKSWPAIACGQYSEALLESELFGYEKGAFTGAQQAQPGLLAKADGDTLLLDEIGDIPRAMQRTLIKAIEEKRYTPVGGRLPKESRFRLISATNKTPTALAEQVDADFLDRVGIFRIDVPPLREIREDLPHIWSGAFTQAAARAHASKGAVLPLSATVTRRILTALEKHPLPGNLRDLLGLAYHILAARTDALEPLSDDDAVTYGLQYLEQQRAPMGPANPAHAVAIAFGENRPLDQVVGQVGSIQTKTLERELRRFVATEVRRLAKARGCDVSELCDVTGRTLTNWLRNS